MTLVRQQSRASGSCHEAVKQSSSHCSSLGGSCPDHELTALIVPRYFFFAHVFFLSLSWTTFLRCWFYSYLSLIWSSALVLLIVPLLSFEFSIDNVLYSVSATFRVGLCPSRHTSYPLSWQWGCPALPLRAWGDGSWRWITVPSRRSFFTSAQPCNLSVRAACRFFGPHLNRAFLSRGSVPSSFCPHRKRVRTVTAMGSSPLVTKFPGNDLNIRTGECLSQRATCWSWWP